tara:strand:+ start:117 stop:1451 length:1335 start_codon:yes stop_codon:yes gene_type:complete
MAVQPFYATGTATVTNGSATVTGTGTAWSIGVVNGGEFSLGGYSVPIAVVDSNTGLTLAYPWPQATATGPYAISLGNAGAASAIEANKRLADFVAAMSEISPYARTLFDDAGADEVLATLGATEVGSAVLTAADETAARAAIDALAATDGEATGLNLAGSRPYRVTSPGFAYFPSASQHLAYYKKAGGFGFFWRKSDDGTDNGANMVELMSLSDAGVLVVNNSEVLRQANAGATGMALLGATNPAGARTAIGATTTGSELLTAVSVDAARAAIGKPDQVIETITIDAGSAFRDINLPAGYDSFELEFYGVNPTTAGDLFLNVWVGGTFIGDTSYWNDIKFANTATTVGFAVLTSQTRWQITGLSVPQGTFNGATGTIKIFPGDGGIRPRFISELNHWANANNFYHTVTASGAAIVANRINALRLSTVPGNTLSGGTIIVKGGKK